MKGRIKLNEMQCKVKNKGLNNLGYSRADVWSYGESGVSREISNFFMFCPGNLYSRVFSKVTFKVSTAYHFENKAYRPPLSSGICAK